MQYMNIIIYIYIYIYYIYIYIIYNYIYMIIYEGVYHPITISSTNRAIEHSNQLVTGLGLLCKSHSAPGAGGSKTLRSASSMGGWSTWCHISGKPPIVGNTSEKWRLLEISEDPAKNPRRHRPHDLDVKAPGGEKRTEKDDHQIIPSHNETAPPWW